MSTKITRTGTVSFKRRDGGTYWQSVREWRFEDGDTCIEYYHTDLNKWVDAESVRQRIAWDKR